MNYVDIEYNENSDIMFQQLAKGAFMTTKVGDKVNTMTIAWGGINLVWNKKVFVAYVRYTRDTYDMLMGTDEFTISVPKQNTLKNELIFCGTKSGKDTNKIKECGLNITKGRKIETPIIDECKTHYECKVIYKQAMEPNNIPDDVLKRHYTNHNFHVIFYGEILDSYITEGEK